jgi:hypothetical protein
MCVCKCKCVVVSVFWLFGVCLRTIFLNLPLFAGSPPSCRLPLACSGFHPSGTLKANGVAAVRNAIMTHCAAYDALH